MSDVHDLYEEKLADLIKEAAALPINEADATTAMKNLETFSKCRPPAPEPEPLPEPKTFWEKASCKVHAIWDNETTRVTIKALGAFAGVGLVVHSTIKQERILERQALAQANQRM